MHRSELTARAVALVYNWWSWYVRAANPQSRREALTYICERITRQTILPSQPTVLSGIG
jgi:hypothetical protein